MYPNSPYTTPDMPPNKGGVPAMHVPPIFTQVRENSDHEHHPSGAHEPTRSSIIVPRSNVQNMLKSKCIADM